MPRQVRIEYPGATYHVMCRGEPATSQRGLGSGAGAWHLSTMSTLIIPMPDEDLEFLRAYSAAQGISAEALLARQARSLRGQLQRPVHPEVTAASGIISKGVAGEDAHRAHLEKKHA